MNYRATTTANGQGSLSLTFLKYCLISMSLGFVTNVFFWVLHGTVALVTVAAYWDATPPESLSALARYTPTVIRQFVIGALIGASCAHQIIRYLDGKARPFKIFMYISLAVVDVLALEVILFWK